MTTSCAASARRSPRSPAADAPDIYAISFFIYDEDDDPQKPTITIGYNTESQVKRVLDPAGRDPDPAHPGGSLSGIRLAIRAVSACSACRSAVPMIRRTRSRAGGSICSPFRCASSSSRTWSTCRSFSHTFAASHSAALSASPTEHSRNPKYLRTSAR
jgi:hypothetical protein